MRITVTVPGVAQLTGAGELVGLMGIVFLGGRWSRRKVAAWPDQASYAKPSGRLQSMTDMTTIKVSVETRDRLKRLADEDHLTLDAELAHALDQIEDDRFWAGVREDYARLQADPQEWDDYASEVAEWDQTAGDGLRNE